jgi:hypothetical protein
MDVYNAARQGSRAKGGTNMDTDTYKNYFRDLVYLLRETGAEARRKSRETGKMCEFEQGRAMAYVEVLSLMQSQAVAFQLPREDLLLAGFDPERDPIDPPLPE